MKYSAVTAPGLLFVVFGRHERSVAVKRLVGGWRWCSFKDLSCSRLTLMGEQGKGAAVTLTETRGNVLKEMKKNQDVSVYM